MMRETILRGEGVTRCYGEGAAALYAMRSVSFSVFPGEFIVVLGPSGSGKSTLLNLMGGMDQPDQGEIWYRDKNLAKLGSDELAAYRRDVVGFVFQFFQLIPSLTAMENVALAANLVRGGMEAERVLGMVGLSERGNHFPSQLSGGEQQRVSIARAIVKNPKLLLCDEPTGALDSVNGAQVMKLLLDIRETLGCPVVTITHNAELAKIADRVFHMKDGQLVKVAVNDKPVAVEDILW